MAEAQCLYISVTRTQDFDQVVSTMLELHIHRLKLLKVIAEEACCSVLRGFFYQFFWLKFRSAKVLGKNWTIGDGVRGKRRETKIIVMDS